ncbi:hypothetical protein OQA88_720 [Cercophora sp. LCS_1]
MEAVFAVAFFWDLAAETSYGAAGPAEVEQLKNIALAVHNSPTLKHFILSALPGSSRSPRGRLPVPHFDYKQVAVDWIKANTPELWKKTTEFWAGFYAANFVTLGPLGFRRIGASETRFLMSPSKPVYANTGIVIEAILKAGPRAFTKTVVLVTDNVSWEDVAVSYERVTGRKAVYIQATDAAYEKLYDDGFGAEFALQMHWSEEYPDWHAVAGENVLTVEELGVAD